MTASHASLGSQQDGAYHHACDRPHGELECNGAGVEQDAYLDVSVRVPVEISFRCHEFALAWMYIARRGKAHATETGWSLRRLRERVLRAGARLIASGWRITLALSSAAAPFWELLRARINTLHWAGR